MEQDLDDFDPFEVIYVWYGYECYPDSEPMTDDDWQEWLENDS